MELSGEMCPCPQAHPIIKLRRAHGGMVSKMAGTMGKALATPLSLAHGKSSLQLQLAAQARPLHLWQRMPLSSEHEHAVQPYIRTTSWQWRATRERYVSSAPDSFTPTQSNIPGSTITLQNVGIAAEEFTEPALHQDWKGRPLSVLKEPLHFA